MLRTLLIGKEKIESHSEYKYALLRAQLGLLLGAICFIYIIIDVVNGVLVYIPWYIAGIAMSILVIIENRKGNYLFSSIILLITANILVFLIANLEDSQGGVFFYFMATSVTSLVVLNPINRGLGIFFVIVSISLAGIAYFGENLPFQPPKSSKNYVDISFTVNFLLGLLSSVLILHFVMDRNRESEQQLINKNKELKKINKELDRFVYSASHDMRAPLSTLLGLLNLAKISSKPAEIKDYHEKMFERIQTMEGFIKEVTDYSRNSRLELRSSRLNLRSIVDEVKNSFEFLSGEACVNVEIDIDPDLEFNSDKERLKVIINNLLSNAIKYSDPNKPNRFVKIQAFINNNCCFIRISDNGIGICSEHQEKIFNMFFRASEKSDGSGLGLYIVKETVQRLKSQINCQSEEGVGTTFKLIIPTEIQFNIPVSKILEKPAIEKPAI